MCIILTLQCILGIFIGHKYGILDLIKPQHSRRILGLLEGGRKYTHYKYQREDNEVHTHITA